MKFYRIYFFVLGMLFSSQGSMAQENVISNVRGALKAGSAKELIKYANDVVEIKIDGESSNYSKTQAEFILKDFFDKNPSQGFDYVFEGNSREGLKYAIGTYTYRAGTYRVYILFKKAGNGLVIDTLDFTKE